MNTHLLRASSFLLTLALILLGGPSPAAALAGAANLFALHFLLARAKPNTPWGTRSR